MTRKEKPRSAIVLVSIAAALFLLPILYLLSAGPAVMLVRNGSLSDAAFAWLYAPVNQLRDSSAMFRDLFHWYVNLLH